MENPSFKKGMTFASPHKFGAHEVPGSIGPTTLVFLAIFWSSPQLGIAYAKPPLVPQLLWLGLCSKTPGQSIEKSYCKNLWLANISGTYQRNPGDDDLFPVSTE